MVRKKRLLVLTLIMGLILAGIPKNIVKAYKSDVMVWVSTEERNNNGGNGGSIGDTGNVAYGTPLHLNIQYLGKDSANITHEVTITDGDKAYFSGQYIGGNQSELIAASGSALSLDEGEYSLIVKSKFKDEEGMEQSETNRAPITVLNNVPAIKVQPKDFKGEVGEEVVFTAETKEEADFDWYMADTPYDSNPQQLSGGHISKSKYATFVYSALNVTERLAGKYFFCEVRKGKNGNPIRSRFAKLTLNGVHPEPTEEPTDDPDTTPTPTPSEEPTDPSIQPYNPNPDSFTIKAVFDKDEKKTAFKSSIPYDEYEIEYQIKGKTSVTKKKVSSLAYVSWFKAGKTYYVTIRGFDANGKHLGTSKRITYKPTLKPKASKVKVKKKGRKISMKATWDAKCTTYVYVKTNIHKKFKKVGTSPKGKFELDFKTSHKWAKIKLKGVHKDGKKKYTAWSKVYSYKF